MRLIKVGNRIVNMEQVIHVDFVHEPEPMLFFRLMSTNSPDLGSIRIIGDLAVKVWEFLCRESMSVELPTSNPWRD